MPLFEYILLAMLGSGGAVLNDGMTPGPILAADAIVQPNGGALSALSIGQDPPKKEDSHRRQELRRRRHKHRRPIRHVNTPKKDAGK